MNRLEKTRWKNLLHKAARVNRFIKKGYIVFDNTNNIVKPFKFDKNKKFIYQEGDYSHNTTYVWGGHEYPWDWTLSIPIEEYNKEHFSGWKVINPKYIENF